MKKVFISTLVLVCLFMIGCSKKEEESNKKAEINLTGGWEIMLASERNDMSEEVVNAFNEAKANYTSLNLDLVALLGSQVVSGTNYMYLAKGYQTGESDKATYKIVVVYRNLEGKSTITKVSDFDFTNYTNVNKEASGEQLSGGWSAQSTGKPYDIPDDKIQSVFNEAVSTLAGMSFKPIAVLGKQLVSGTNYAILCFGAATVPDAIENVYLLTVYEDLEGTCEVVSHAYIDLALFNK